jgi:hypothetical protein
VTFGYTIQHSATGLEDSATVTVTVTLTTTPV